MAEGRFTARQLFWTGAAGVLVLLVVAAVAWRTEIQRALLDPGVPYQIYKPPPAPDYARAQSWALLPARPEAAPSEPGVDVFFVHATTYKGGREWNAPIGASEAEEQLARVMIPNYAGPFRTLGRVFAPRYRQASSYAFTTLRDDAREARRFPLRDIEAALQTYIDRWSQGRPLILVGVGQGGELLGRAVSERLAKDPEFRRRIVAVYLIHVLTPAARHGPGSPLPACQRRDEAGCLVAWKQPPEDTDASARNTLERGLVWTAGGQLEPLGQVPPVCVNPLTGSENGRAGERENLGAANATGLEWNARPALLPRQVSAECKGGLLRVRKPRSPAFAPPKDWVARLRAPPFNLFYADLEADARARVAAFLGGAPAPPIERRIEVRSSPVHRID